MTQQHREPGYSLSQEYTAPRDEWAALLTLAAKQNPGHDVEAGEWRPAFFTSEEACEAFDRIAAASQPLKIAPPTDFADAQPLADPAQLPKLRELLADWMSWRKAVDLQQNLATHTLAMFNAKGTEQEAELLRRGHELVSSSMDALGRVERLGRGSTAPVTATLGALADVQGYWARVQDARDAMPTGLGGLDKLLGGGFQAKRLAILLGGPGGGKSTLSNQIAEHIADAGRPVAYLTLEDGAAVMLARTVSRIGNIDYAEVLSGSERHRRDIEYALAKIADRQSAERLLYVEDAPGGHPIHPDALRDIAVAHFAAFLKVKGGGRGLLVVDYLQRWARALRMLPEFEKRELREVVGWLTERLRQIARELDCSVLCIASQNRASGYGNGGGDALASAKESGDIEYSADVVLALGKPGEKAARTAPLHCEARVLRVDKNRQGPIAPTPLDLDWRGDRQQFTEAAK